MITKRTTKTIIIGILFYLVLLTYAVLNTIHSEFRPGVKLSSDSATYMFNLVQSFGFSDYFLIIDILPLLIIPAVSSFYPTFIKNNNELSNVIQRINYKQYLKKSVLMVFSVASIFSLIIELYEVILINWFYFPFMSVNYSLDVIQRPHFSHNTLINLIIYIVASSIGWGIFSVFVFAISLFVKKNVICLILGPIVGFILIFAVMFIGVNAIGVLLINELVPINLVSPGQASVASQMPPLGLTLTWIIIAILYSLVAYLLIHLWHKKQLRGA